MGRVIDMQKHCGEYNIFDDVGLQTLILFMMGNKSGNLAVVEMERDVLQNKSPEILTLP